MIDSILEYISSNREVIKESEKAYRYFYSLFKNDTLNKLNKEDIKNIVKKLDLETGDLFICSLEENYLDMMKYIVEFEKDPVELEKVIRAQDDYALELLLSKNNLEAIEYIFNKLPNKLVIQEMIASFDYLVFSKASKYGKLEVLEYLVKLNTNKVNLQKMIHTNDDLPFINAASNGHIECIKYLIELTPDPIILDKMIHAKYDLPFIKAAQQGHLDVMKYLVELEPTKEKVLQMIKAQFNRAFVVSILNNKQKALEYLIELMSNNEIFYLINKNNGALFFNIIEHGNIEILELILNYIPYFFQTLLIEYGGGISLLIAARRGDFILFEFVFKLYNNYQSLAYSNCSKRIISEAISQGNMDILKLIISNKKEFYDQKLLLKTTLLTSLKEALTKQKFNVIEYLILEVIDDQKTRKEFLHSDNDAFIKKALYSNYIIALKYFYLLDPFYVWNNDNNTLLKNYKNIDIMSIKNIATCSKSLFSENYNSISKKEDCNLYIEDLPIDLLYLIVGHVAGVMADNDFLVKSAIEAFTFNSENYTNGFEGFVERYEQALYKLSGELVVEDL